MLLGRVEERREVDRLLSAARGGTSSVLALVGEAGIGKTTVLSYAAGRAEVGGFRLLRARGVESETHIPFSALLELLRPVLRLIEQIPEPQAVAIEGALALRPSLPTERFAVGAGTLSLLAAAAEDAPLAVLIDDAQWLDPSSAEALRFALRRLVADPIAVLLAAREHEPSLLDDTDLPVHRIGGLTRDEAAELLAGAVPGQELSRSAYLATGGNPLALLEVRRSADLLALAQGPALVPVPAAISEEFLRRAGALDPTTSSLVVLAATHDRGDAPTVERAARLLGLDFSAIGQAERAGLLSIEEGRLEFRHPLARSAVYGAASPAERREAHRALASVLSDRDADRRAWHLASAAVGTDPAAASALRQAGERAYDRSAYAVASIALERAARFTPDDPERGTCLWKAAEAAWLAGMVERTAELLDQAKAHCAERDRQVRIAQLEGQVAMHVGDVMGSYRVLVEGAAAAAPDDAVELLADAVLAGFQGGDAHSMLEAARRAESLLSAGSSPLARFLALTAKGISLVIGGDGRDGAEALRAAAAVEGIDDLDGVEGAGGTRESPGDVRLTTWALIGPIFLREQMHGRPVVDDTLQLVRSRTAVGALPFLLNCLARDQAGGGEWAASEACLDECIRLARETGQRGQLAAALSGIAFLEARQGREEPCRSHAAEALALSRELGTRLFEVWALAALGDLEAGLGRPGEAIRHFEQLLQLLAASSITDADLSPRPELVDALVRVGRIDEAGRIAEEFDVAAAAKRQPWSLARARRAMAQVVGDDEFEGWFDDALRLHAETPDRFEHARTQLAFGERLRRSRRRSQARTVLGQAFETFEGLGARPWAELARRELAAAGATVRPRGGGTLGELTPQELQVASLLAGGMTTREAAAALFLSPKTVEYHLRHVYLKLAIRSRDELAPALEQPAPVPSGPPAR